MRYILQVILSWGVIALGILFSTASIAVTPTANKVAELLASDGTTLDQFGFSVAVEGDTAVIGSRFDDDNGDDSGSVYVCKTPE
jgi:FG-GAP repeat